MNFNMFMVSRMVNSEDSVIRFCCLKASRNEFPNQRWLNKQVSEEDRAMFRPWFVLYLLVGYQPTKKPDRSLQQLLFLSAPLKTVQNPTGG
jgi:hypothetical protein